jgi:hypothetical protein
MRAAARELEDMMREVGIDPDEPREPIDLETAIETGLKESKRQQKRMARAIRQSVGEAARRKGSEGTPRGAVAATPATEAPSTPDEPPRLEQPRKRRPTGHAGWIMPQLYDADDDE